MADFPFNPSAREYDPVNSYALAQLAHLAYSGKGDTRKQLGKWGFDLKTYTHFDRGETQAFLAATATYTVVSLRGTEALLGDWLNNLNAHLTGGPLQGRVHEGFASALNAIWLDLLPALRDTQHDADGQRTLWLTGHSLGGALAVLATAKLLERTAPVDGLYTFGAPRVGDPTFAAGFSALFPRLWRVVHEGDPVPRVPFRPLYGDLGNVRFITYAADAVPVLADELAWNRWLRAVSFASGDVQERKSGAIKEHSLEQSYLPALKLLAGQV